MNQTRRRLAFALMVLALSVRPALAELAPVEPLKVDQTGNVPAGAAQPGTVVLANEPDGGSAGFALEFDLEPVPHKLTPLARIQLVGVDKVKLSRAGEKPSTEKGALHAFVQPVGSDAPRLVGSCVVKAGFATPYTIDVTGAVSEALARSPGQRKVRIDVRMTGKPAYFEVYVLPTAPGKAFLEIAPPTNWENDWPQRVAPITSGPLVYREACMPIAAKRDAELELKLLYPAKKVVEVIHNGTGERLEEGRDWALRDGKLILPRGTHAPVQVEAEFFARPPSTAPSTAPVSNKPPALLPLRLQEGTFYHERQIEVTYEPAARDWSFPPAVSSPAKLPRVHKLLTEKKRVRVILFGDSITYGGNASKHQGCWPYQPQYGELAMWAVQQHYGAPVEVMNHSRGGAVAQHGAELAESQAGWFKPDLVVIGYGMNNRSEKRRPTYRQDLETLIDKVRAVSPDTEFILVTSMLNNPKQPSGLEPILSLRDEALRIDRPGLAFVDMTTTHLELCKRKNYLDTSGNGANHPNDFLHRIYAMRVMEVLMPAPAQ